MADFTVKDIQALRSETGAGMMDAKRALTESDGDMDAARKWLREHGLAKAAGRTDRDSSEGVVSIAVSGSNAGLVELKCETDFVAKSEAFAPFADELAAAVADGGEAALAGFSDRVDDLKVRLKENISIGRTARLAAADGDVLGIYLHRQDGRGVNAVAVALAGGSDELAHDIAVHIAFTKPTALSRDDVPVDEVAAERTALEDITRAEGKPEAALTKIVEGRLSGWFAERVVLEQKYVKDEKQTISKLLEGAGATLVRFEQLVVGS
ncbi:MAG TPA: translation elongation factor Ts [Acidimicrobiales bacterium]|nr:translation elongation factor Ts [Acidimicrobiales bacterium]